MVGHLRPRLRADCVAVSVDAFASPEIRLMAAEVARLRGMVADMWVKLDHYRYWSNGECRCGAECPL